MSMFKNCKTERQRVKKVCKFIKATHDLVFDLDNFDTEEEITKEINSMKQLLANIREARKILANYQNRKVDEYRKQYLEEKKNQK